MKTEIITVNPDNVNPVYIKTAAEKIKDGGLVAFPTETVYGLGADAFNPKAVAKIFEVKKNKDWDDFEADIFALTIAQVAQKKLVETIKKDTNDNLFGISDDLWESMCKLLEVK